MFDFEKEYDLVKTTIEEIRSARRRIQAAADEQRKVEEKAILDRARATLEKI